MNYPPNKVRWVKGDVVIHDYDAKEPKMLMKVIGYTRKGDFCKTQYIDTSHTRRIYHNEIDYLHDADKWFYNQFDINPNNIYLMNGDIQIQFENVRRWNLYRPIGTVVDVKLDSGEIFRTKTRSQAVLQGGSAWIFLEDVVGSYLLRCISPVVEKIESLLMNTTEK